MSLQKYTALLKTVELGSISRAAEEMGYTQSAVSRMIADLEELRLVTDIVMWAALILTVVSLADYLMKNREVMRETK